MLSKNGIVIIMTVQASNADAGSLLAIERNLGLSCCWADNSINWVLTDLRYEIIPPDWAMACAVSGILFLKICT